MVARRSGLGKGLGSLIPTTERLQDSDAILRELPISEIVANTYQPRSHFDEEALVSLSASIRSVGVLQPILVRELGEDSYELIAGERRWRAAKRAGLQTIPAIVRTAEDEGSLEQALVENLHREDLGALEEAAAYQQLIEEFKLTQDQVATRVGKSRSAVANTMRLLQLPTSIQRLLGDGQLSAGHARALLGTPDRAFQEKLAKAIVSEKLTVREVEDRVREHGGTPEPEAGGSTATGTKPPTLVRPAPLLELEEMLSDHLDTRVAVSMGQRKGRIVIDFSTLEDLERVYRVIVDGKEPMD
ncbi:MAG: ParB/RepB/Spo0J family partition protein [Actinobacteria bacterium]|nr:ParB/RepB/Spo0J family partition protein [Actinomycetota bacterium]MSZ93444.1 ParB/RepB/Spo0J family partition protein [Actinomycetota bacterium]